MRSAAPIATTLVLAFAGLALACKPPGAHKVSESTPGSAAAVKLAAVSDPLPLKDAAGARASAAEIVEATLKRLEQRVAIETMPAAVAEQRTLFGNYAAAFPLERTSDREQIFLFSAPVLKRGGVTLHLAVPRSAPDGAAFIERFDRALAELPVVGVAP